MVTRLQYLWHSLVGMTSHPGLNQNRLSTLMIELGLKVILQPQVSMVMMELDERQCALIYEYCDHH